MTSRPPKTEEVFWPKEDLLKDPKSIECKSVENRLERFQTNRSWEQVVETHYWSILIGLIEFILLCILVMERKH